MRLIVIGLTLCLATACGQSEPPKKTVFDSQIKAIDKARDVEQTLEEAAKAQRKQIEQETESR